MSNPQINDQRHRDDGPAIVSIFAGKHWYQHGKRHREDGPAVESPDGAFW